MAHTHSFFHSAAESSSESGDEGGSGSGSIEEDGKNLAVSSPASDKLIEEERQASNDAKNEETDRYLEKLQEPAVPEAVASNPAPTSSEAADKIADELKEFRFLALMGDYAGRFWNILKSAAAATNRDVPDSVETMRDSLRLEDVIGAGYHTETLGICLKHLEEEGKTATPDMARLAIEIYTDRNLSCHSKIGKRGVARDLPALGRAIAKDIVTLDRFLPDNQRPNRQTLEDLMRFYSVSAAWFYATGGDQTTTAPPSPPTPEDHSDAFKFSGLRDVSPVKSRSVSPSERTVSGSSQLSSNRPSANPDSATVEEGPRADYGILEVIAKLQSTGSEKASIAIEDSRKRLLATLDSLEHEEEPRRKRGRYN
ncbi:uncharacterized protein LDX57_003761 [Aspergillus melleus]|uniref:uncharacterized protein n=1 Tax=Aspergillus melleus TaxID=138277 RepID=UPI001E8D4E25|nr:uncharacterized protein LDX57_003761 [Aspergillus melleus]KAH8426020.1 hypothetical protein LDX57_003761 [Aspergillus melleus]